MNVGVEVATRTLGASSDEASSQPASTATLSSIELATTKAPAKKWQVSVFVVQCSDMFS